MGGVSRTELSELPLASFLKEGYSTCAVTLVRAESIIRATSKECLMRRVSVLLIRELTALVQTDSRYKFLGGLAICGACYYVLEVLRFVMGIRC